ncbi:MAG: metal-sensitive transcriptional regulator [Trueperaceae bacterium]
MDRTDTTRRGATGELPAAQEPDCLHLDPATRQDAVRRLKGARGHLEGVLRMLDDPSVYCVDVMKQLSAVQGAITKVNEKVLRSHIRDHVSTAILRGDTDEIVDELMEALKYRA